MDMEILVYICLIAFIATMYIKGMIISAVEDVRKHIDEQSRALTLEVNRMFDSHQTAMTKKLNNLTTTIYTLDPMPRDPSAKDVLLYDVAKWAIENQGISTSAVQRHFSISFSRAGRIVDQLCELGVFGKVQENHVRPVLITMDNLDAMDKSGVFG